MRASLRKIGYLESKKQVLDSYFYDRFPELYKNLLKWDDYFYPIFKK
jgi:hypothetical protein